MLNFNKTKNILNMKFEQMPKPLQEEIKRLESQGLPTVDEEGIRSYVEKSYDRQREIDNMPEQTNFEAGDPVFKKPKEVIERETGERYEDIMFREQRDEEERRIEHAKKNRAIFAERHNEEVRALERKRYNEVLGNKLRSFAREYKLRMDGLRNPEEAMAKAVDIVDNIDDYAERYRDGLRKLDLAEHALNRDTLTGWIKGMFKDKETRELKYQEAKGNLDSFMQELRQYDEDVFLLVNKYARSKEQERIRIPGLSFIIMAAEGGEDVSEYINIIRKAAEGYNEYLQEKDRRAKEIQDAELEWAEERQIYDRLYKY